MRDKIKHSRELEDWETEICGICGEAIGREPCIPDDEGGYIHVACVKKRGGIA